MRLVLKIWLMIVAFSVPYAADAEGRHALIIGNANYSGSPMSPLLNPVNDATLMAEQLTTLGFEVDLLVDADQTEMKRAIQRLGNNLREAGPDATGLFYFSGHGFQVSGQNYLAPLRANLRTEADADIEAVQANWVLDQMEAAGSSVNIVILDACRNTALTGTTRSATRGFAPILAPTGSFIAYATAPGEVAYDGDTSNSPFTAALARELVQTGQSIEAVFKNVRVAVIEETGGDQTPWDASSLTTDFYFIQPDADLERSGGEISLVVDPEIEFWRTVNASGARDDYEAYLSAFPEGVFRSLAKKKISGMEEAELLERIPVEARQYQNLARSGILVEDPKEPHEFYANARLYDLTGDFRNARSSYLSFVNFGLEFVDPHLEFQSFLKIQEGLYGARETYQSLARRFPDNLAFAFAEALLYPPERRIEKLQTVIDSNPTYAPALYMLSREYSYERIGQQTLADKRTEKDLLDRFMTEAEEGALVRLLMDKGLAEEWIADAESRLAALGELVMAKNPMTFSAMNHNSGWTLTFSVLEGAEEIFMARDGEDFKSTGFMGQADFRTGKPMPQSFTSLPIDMAAETLRFKYRDTNGVMQGPFEYAFDPAVALFEGQKQTLGMTNTSWLAFSTHMGADRPLLYFTHLMSYACAIEKIEYGLDVDVPDQEWTVAPCNPLNPHAVTDEVEIYRDVPVGTRKAVARLTFKDGTVSDIEEFRLLNR